MGVLRRLSKMRISVGSSALQVDPERAAQLARQAYETRALFGPAGVASYGPGPAPEPPYDPPPPRYADVPQQAAHEYHERAAARAPYLAPNRSAVTISRVASAAGNGVTDVAAHVAATGLSARPDLVFGVYQVPDHIGRTSLRRNSRYVEWDVVHVPTVGLPPGPHPQAIHLDARHRWVARASSQPSILDEDLAIGLLQWAGVGPEHALGVARQLASEAGGSGEGRSMYARIAVTSINVLASSPVNIGEVATRAAAAAPLDLPAGPPAGVHIECLDWKAIARAVHPRTGTPFPVPSPFPYLPSTPQELLVSHLEVVGVAPTDCYSAQITVDQETDILDRESHGWFTSSTDIGMRQPCADGEQRPRLAGATMLVIAYRDRPEYATGRERWAAYEREVLMARLSQRRAIRPPVPAMDLGSLPAPARNALKAAGSVTAFLTTWPTDDDRFDDIPDARYCWPPTDAR